MRSTSVTMEITDGEMGDLVTEDFAKNPRGRHGKLFGQANDATLEMDSSQCPAEPSAPLDSHALLEASEPPAVPVVSQQALDAPVDGAAAGWRHAHDASTFRLFLAGRCASHDPDLAPCVAGVQSTLLGAGEIR